jgi:hypothetical protein
MFSDATYNDAVKDFERDDASDEAPDSGSNVDGTENRGEDGGETIDNGRTDV